jgi:murein DD-endopeptidase MepM/ murein hydrolase activator NlpD
MLDFLAALLLGGASLTLPSGFVLDRAAEQGNVVIITAPPGAVALMLDEQNVPLDKDGKALIAFGREAPPEASIAALMPDGSQRRETIGVSQRRYDIQRVDGLPPRTVQLSPEDQLRRKGEVERIGAARRQVAAISGWRGTFIWPATGRISGVYGSQRIRNGVPGSPHNGVDVAAPTGAAVVAPADGLVRLAAPDMLLEGGLIILDHGGGLFSDFLHLSRIDVTEGQVVKAGDRLGAVGGTGRATGPHLHWGMKWRDARLDPVKVGDLSLPAKAATPKNQQSLPKNP